MADLRAAIGRFDDVLRTLDAVGARANTLGDRVDVASSGFRQASQDLASVLGDAMPDGLASALARRDSRLPTTIGELATFRAELARLGSVARAVDELGGVETVVSQGGLDAIDGAAVLVQRGIYDDAVRQADGVRSILDDAPGGLIVTNGSRTAHLKRVQARAAAPGETLRATTGAPYRAQLPDIDYQLGHMSRDSHAHALDKYRVFFSGLNASSPIKLDEPGLSFLDETLASRAARRAAEASSFGSIADAPALSRLPDDVVLEHATARMELHVARFDRLVEELGDLAPYKPEFKRAVAHRERQIHEAIDDAAVLERALDGSPELGVDRAYLVQDWGRFLLKESGSFGGGDTKRMVPNLQQYLRDLRDEVARLADDPSLLRAGEDATEEARSILERSGPLDVAALRALLDSSDAPRAARAAIARHITELAPHPVDAPMATSVDEAQRLLDEAELLSDALTGAATGKLGRNDLLLNDPSLVDATTQLLARGESALGVADRVPERLGARVRQSIGDIRDSLDTFESPYSYKLPEARKLEGLDKAMLAYRTELSKVTDRATTDGGLRAIAPSARPQQAREAQSTWLMRELDSLPAVAPDAPPEQHVDSAARRLSLIADLLDGSISGRYSSEVVDESVLQRAGSELAAMDDLWRHPDDTALSLAGARQVFEAGQEAVTARLRGSGNETISDQLRRTARELRSWSAMTDGRLPTSSLDRISVGARRSDSLRAAAASPIGAKAEHGRQFLGDWVDMVDTRLVDVDTVMGRSMPTEQRTAIDDALVRVRASLDERAELAKSYRTSSWKPDEEAVEIVRSRIAELDDEIQRINVEARADDARQLTW